MLHVCVLTSLTSLVVFLRELLLKALPLGLFPEPPPLHPHLVLVLPQPPVRLDHAADNHAGHL